MQSAVRLLKVGRRNACKWSDQMTQRTATQIMANTVIHRPVIQSTVIQGAPGTEILHQRSKFSVALKGYPPSLPPVGITFQIWQVLVIPDFKPDGHASKSCV